ncbi:hypothetical protein ACFL2K_00445 [Candidatus Margulisiibacteriota bacterium]
MTMRISGTSRQYPKQPLNFDINIVKKQLNNPKISNKEIFNNLMQNRLGKNPLVKIDLLDECIKPVHIAKRYALAIELAKILNTYKDTNLVKIAQKIKFSRNFTQAEKDGIYAIILNEFTPQLQELYRKGILNL